MQLVRIHPKLYFESHATVPMVIFHNVISSMDHLWKYTKWPLKNWNLVITICRLKMPKVRVIRLQSICGHVMFLFFEYFSYCSFDSLTFSGETFHLRTQNLKKRVFSCSRLEGIKYCRNVHQRHVWIIIGYLQAPAYFRHHSINSKLIWHKENL